MKFPRFLAFGLVCPFLPPFTVWISSPLAAGPEEIKSEVMLELQAISRELKAMSGNSVGVPPKDDSKEVLRSSLSTESALPATDLPSTPSAVGSPGNAKTRDALSEIRLELDEISIALNQWEGKNASSSDTPDKPAPSIGSTVPTVREPSLPAVALSGEPSVASFNSFETNSYLIIRPRLHFSPDLQYHGFSTTGNIETNAGIGLALDLGRSFGDFDLGVSVGFTHTGLEDITLSGDTFASDGDAHNYHLSLLLGYRTALSERLSLKVGTGLGLASRHTLYDIDTLGYSLADQSVVFLGELQLSVSLDLSERNALFAGYRFSYLSEAGSFGDTHQHALEFGSEWTW